MRACGILVSRPGMEPTSPVVGAWNLNYWTTREACPWWAYGFAPLIIPLSCFQSDLWGYIELSSCFMHFLLLFAFPFPI